MHTVAIVGCGRISAKHLRVLESNRHFRLVAACDRYEDRARATHKRWYTDVDRMCNSRKPDVVVICTEPSQHARIAKQVIRYGCNVLTEKPIALRLDHAIEMIETAKMYNVKLWEVKQNRYNKPVQFLKQMIQGGILGKINMATVRVRWCRNNEYYTQDPYLWRGTWEHDGGVFASQGSHHVDLLRWLIGDVRSVVAQASNNILDIEVEDTGIAMIEFESGANGVIEATNAARPENLEASISILGENGSIVVGGTCANKLEFFNVPGIGETQPTQYSEETANIYGNGHAAVYDNIHREMEGEPADVVTGEDALQTLHLIHMIYRSIEFNHRVYAESDVCSTRLGQK